MMQMIKQINKLINYLNAILQKADDEQLEVCLKFYL